MEVCFSALCRVNVGDQNIRVSMNIPPGYLSYENFGMGKGVSTAVRLFILSWTGFPLDLENLENLEKWEYTWKTWKYHWILKNLINIMEKWYETWKNLVATKNSPFTPLKQYKIH